LDNFTFIFPVKFEKFFQDKLNLLKIKSSVSVKRIKKFEFFAQITSLNLLFVKFLEKTMLYFEFNKAIELPLL
jgi:hypothetical protein